MNFLEAVEAMKEGHKVRRNTYFEGYYRYIERDTMKNEEGDFWDVDLGGIEATDWEIVEDKKTLFDKAHSVPVESEEDYTFRGEDVKEHLKEFIESITRRFMCNLRKKARKERQG